MERSSDSRSICLVAPSLQLGGLENEVAIMSDYLAEAGHRVRLVLCYRAEHFYSLNSKVEVVEPGFLRKGRFKALFYLRWLVFLRAALTSFDSDVVLSYGEFHNALALLSTRFSGISVVIKATTSPNRKVGRAVRVLRGLTYSRAAGIICQTERALPLYKRLGHGLVPVEVIPNPVRIHPHSPTQHRRPFILAVGRHYLVKGLDRLIKAFAECEASGWTLIIAGSAGPETENLNHLVQELNLSEQVRILGPVSDMSTLYAQASIFVLPSRSEGLPNALIEAMVHGCAPISFDIETGPAELIRDGENGILIEDGNLVALSEAISRLIADKEYRDALGVEATKLEAKLSIETIGEKFESFLLESSLRCDG